MDLNEISRRVSRAEPESIIMLESQKVDSKKFSNTGNSYFLRLNNHYFPLILLLSSLDSEAPAIEKNGDRGALHISRSRRGCFAGKFNSKTR